MRAFRRLVLVVSVACLPGLAEAQNGCFEAKVVSRVPTGISKAGTQTIVYDSLAREEEGGTALYFCGWIKAILDAPANGIVRFDGKQWQGVGEEQHLLYLNPGLSESRPSGLTEIGGNLVVVGKAMLLKDHGYVRAASWDGAYWSPLDVPIADLKEALQMPRFYDTAEYHSVLFAAGDDGVFVWDDGKWVPKFTFAGSTPLQVRTYKDSLYIAGNFHKIIDGSGIETLTGGIARFDGSTVSGIGHSAFTSGGTRWLRVENDLLYSAGTQHIVPWGYGVLSSWDGDKIRPLTPTGFGISSNVARGFLLGDRTTILMYGSFYDDSVIVEATGMNGEITSYIDGFARTLDRLGGVVYASGEITSSRGEPTPLIARIDDGRVTSGIGGWQAPNIGATIVTLSTGVKYKGGYAFTSFYGSYSVPGVGSSRVAFTEDGVNFTPMGLRTDPGSPLHAQKIWGGDHGVVAYGTVRVPSGGFVIDSFTVWTGKSWSQVAQTPLPLAANPLTSAFFTAFDRAHVVCDGAAGAHIFALIGQGWVEVTPPIARERLDFAGQLGDTIVVGGKFTNAAGQECPVAILKNDVWEFIPGTLGPVSSKLPIVTGLIDWNGQYLMTGLFETVDGVQMHGVAVWNGSGWERLGNVPTPFTSGVSRVFQLNGGWYFFDTGVASSDGSNWRFIAGGWDEVEQFRDRPWLAQLADGRVYSVGLFGEGEVQYLAEVLECSPCYADCDGSGALDVFDFVCFQNHFAFTNQEADCDENGTLDAFDYLCFVEAFALGC